MRDELERVRDWAKGQIQIGSEAPASWDQYVTLIESADAILHEMAVSATSRGWRDLQTAKTTADFTDRKVE